MDVISDTCPVVRRIVGSEHRNAFSTAGCRIEQQGNQMSFGIVRLADLIFWVGAGRVEVAQHDCLECVSYPEIREQTLNHRLGCAVGIDRRLRCLSRIGNIIGNAVGGARARKDDLVYPVISYGFQKR